MKEDKEKKKEKKEWTPHPPPKKKEKRLTSVRSHPCAPKLESPRRRRGGKSPDRGGRGTLDEVEMAVAAKEANTVVTSTGKEGDLVKRSDMAMVIELVGVSFSPICLC